MKKWTLVVVILVNAVALWFGPGSAVTRSDPVVVAFAVYGLCHIEWVMLQWTIRIVLWTDNYVRNGA